MSFLHFSILSVGSLFIILSDEFLSPIAAFLEQMSTAAYAFHEPKANLSMITRHASAILAL